MKTIEYRVRPVTRYIVTRYTCERLENGNENGGSCETKGEFDSQETAYHVGYALAKEEVERLGLPPGDMGVIFPEPIGYTTLVPAPQTFTLSSLQANSNPGLSST